MSNAVSRIYDFYVFKSSFTKGGFSSEGIDAFPQTDEPYYFPELEFWICDILKGSDYVK